MIDALVVQALDMCVLWSTSHDCWLVHVFDMMSQTFRSDSSLLSKGVCGDIEVFGVSMSLSQASSVHLSSGQ